MGSMAVFDQTGASTAPFVVLLVRFIHGCSLGPYAPTTQTSIN